jgi:phospholipid/cholesterol/gamma-HCH transport system substrate-binding protein
MKNNSNTEIVVGAFLALGLALMGGLILVFGGFAQGMGPSYQLVVEFENASDLIKGATVTFSGAPIGKVTKQPYPIAEGRAVAVHLKIQKTFKIRRGARFLIGSKGMLGDRYVDVQQGSETEPYLEDGAHVKGARTPGFDELAANAKPIMERMNTIAMQVESITQKLDQEVMTPETTQDAKEAIQSLKKVLARADELLAQAQRGKGPLAKLLNDEKMARDLSAFMTNLKEHGPVFYEDNSAENDKKESEKASSKVRPIRR